MERKTLIIYNCDKLSLEMKASARSEVSGGRQKATLVVYQANDNVTFKSQIRLNVNSLMSYLSKPLICMFNCMYFFWSILNHLQT